MALKPLVHEIRIQNQVIFLDPPIEHARASWIHQLHEWLGMEHLWNLPLLANIYMQALCADYAGYKVLAMKLACRCKLMN